MSERNVYREIPDKVLLRTEDVYQTESQDDIESYSDKLLSIVADFKNSGKPDGYNAQAMVGKSKKGEVAIRLFARIDPETHMIEAAGFKTRGCLAMTGCASALCGMIEGKTLEDALQIGVEDIRQAVDGVPSGKVNTLHFSVCAAKALAADFLLGSGKPIEGLDAQLACDRNSIDCIMAEHCSYRTSQIEERERLEEERLKAIENNAIAQTCDFIKERSKQGCLSTMADWQEAQLVPAHMSKRKFEEAVLSHIERQNPQDRPSSQEADNGASAGAAHSHGKKTGSCIRSKFANRGVGIPKRAQKPLAGNSEDIASSMPETIRAIPVEPTQSDPDHIPTFDDLEVPPDCTLEEIDGEWVLVKHAHKDEVEGAEDLLAIDAKGIKVLNGKERTYYFDSVSMTDNFAHWAFLGAEDDPVIAFSDCVREESRTYPRPMALSNFENDPLNLSAQEVESIFASIKDDPSYADIGRIVASNGDVYFYSQMYLDDRLAQSLAEYDAVERFMNV